MKTKAVLLVLTLALMAAGCSSSSSSAPSKASYDKQANGTCSIYNTKVNQLVGGITASASVSEAVSDLSQAATYGREDVKKLEALPRPAGEASQLQQAFNTLSQGITLIEQLKQALQQANASELQSIEAKLKVLNSKVNQQFDALGLKVCGSDSGSTA